MRGKPRGGARFDGELWSFNCGYLAGLWNLSHFMETLEQRPVAVCVQDPFGRDSKQTWARAMRLSGGQVSFWMNMRTLFLCQLTHSHGASLDLDRR